MPWVWFLLVKAASSVYGKEFPARNIRDESLISERLASDPAFRVQCIKQSFGRQPEPFIAKLVGFENGFLRGGWE